MLLQSEWLDRFIPTCARVRSARRRPLAAEQLVYSTFPDGRCWVVAPGTSSCSTRASTAIASSG